MGAERGCALVLYGNGGCLAALFVLHDTRGLAFELHLEVLSAC